MAPAEDLEEVCVCLCVCVWQGWGKLTSAASLAFIILEEGKGVGDSWGC